MGIKWMLSAISEEEWWWDAHLSILSKEEWWWDGHLSTVLSLRRHGDGVAAPPFYLKGPTDGMHTAPFFFEGKVEGMFTSLLEWMAIYPTYLKGDGDAYLSILSTENLWWDVMLTCPSSLQENGDGIATLITSIQDGDTP